LLLQSRLAAQERQGEADRQETGLQDTEDKRQQADGEEEKEGGKGGEEGKEGKERKGATT